MSCSNSRWSKLTLSVNRTTRRSTASSNTPERDGLASVDGRRESAAGWEDCTSAVKFGEALH